MLFCNSCIILNLLEPTSPEVITIPRTSPPWHDYYDEQEPAGICILTLFRNANGSLELAP